MTKTKNILLKTTNFKEFHVNGLLFNHYNNNLYRLPNNLFVDEGVNNQQKQPSGAYIDFISNASSIGVNVKVKSKSYMPHFTATGTIGLDLYILENEKYVFLGTTKIDQTEFSYTFIKGIPRSNKEFRLYLPTYVELLDLDILINKSADIKPKEKFDLPKIICYGTSITQGGCASRGGMTYPSIMGRWLNNYEVFNLGFSGNANLHPEIANLIGEVENVKFLIIEAEANAGDESGVLIDRLELFLQVIIDKNPNLKIFLVSHFPYSLALYNPSIKAKLLRHKLFQQDLCKKYSKNVEFVDGHSILSELNYEETVDLIHLTDLGFYYLAKYFVARILKKEAI